MTTKKKPTTKTAEPAPTKPAKKKSASKGKRYTPAERKKVISFVESVNAKKGRGGVTAAVKKFGVTALTISTWIKKEGEAAKKGNVKVTSHAKGTSTDVLDQLVALRDEISGLESQLAAKRSQFDTLKGKL